MKNKKICWVIANEQSGFLSQALGLAEALGVDFVKKTFIRKFPFSFLPLSFLLSRSPSEFLTQDSDIMDEPWPDIVIASGSKSINIARYIRETSKKKTYTVYIQDPRISPDNFDMIFSMYHDKIEGKNVCKTNMSLHRITDVKLEEEKKKYSYIFEEMTTPFHSVLVGGITKNYKMNKTQSRDLVNKIQKIIQLNNGTTLITTSRRTPKYMVSLLDKHFGTHKRVYITNPEKENPYFAMLAISDKIFVTNESVSMISEACATGKEVYLIELLGMNRDKLNIFARNLINQRWVSNFKGHHTTPPNAIKYNETQRAANLLKEKLILERDFKENDFNPVLRNIE
ncbi:MAG: mitochondrial fission ELM1 family protein [Alphaproteobacteria bacterium]|nr:mitochondrial fission ELM1 family protein [Alphaproteobacteria bacterium]